MIFHGNALIKNAKLVYFANPGRKCSLVYLLAHNVSLRWGRTIWNCSLQI